jgi:hypothetical protein
MRIKNNLPNINLTLKTKRIISYGHYNIHRMEITTIQLSKELRDNIATFGSKNETYDTILKRIYALAVKEQLREFMMSDENCISIDEAIRRHKEEWPE